MYDVILESLNKEGLGLKYNSEAIGNYSYCPLTMLKVYYLKIEKSIVSQLICVTSTHDNSQKILTESSKRDEDPVWTPDGSKIIFTHGSNKKQLNNGRNGKAVIVKK